MLADFASTRTLCTAAVRRQRVSGTRLPKPSDGAASDLWALGATACEPATLKGPSFLDGQGAKAPLSPDGSRIWALLRRISCGMSSGGSLSQTPRRPTATKLASLLLRAGRLLWARISRPASWKARATLWGQCRVCPFGAGPEDAAQHIRGIGAAIGPSHQRTGAARHSWARGFPRVARPGGSERHKVPILPGLCEGLLVGPADARCRYWRSQDGTEAPL